MKIMSVSVRTSVKEKELDIVRTLLTFYCLGGRMEEQTVRHETHFDFLMKKSSATDLMMDMKNLQQCGYDIGGIWTRI